MPLNKNQQIRTRILDECLSNLVKWHSIEDLLEKVNDYLVREAGLETISRRTLYSDLERLQHPDLYNAELDKKVVNRVVYYRYKDPHFSIHKSPISPQQLTELQTILQSLEQVSNFPFGAWLDTLREDSTLLPPSEGRERSLIGIDHNPDLTGIHHFTDAFQAIIHQQVLEIRYRDFSDSDFKYIFHPYYLKQYNQRWFLIGLNEAEPEVVWTLALDRIQGLKTIPRQFSPTEMDFDDHFYDIIGVTHYPEVTIQEILLRFSPESLPYVMTKPLHPSQKKVKTNDEILIRIRVKPNYELYSVLRSFGRNVEVVEPVSVRNAFVEELRAALSVYEKS